MFDPSRLTLLVKRFNKDSFLRLKHKLKRYPFTSFTENPLYEYRQD